RWLSGILCLPGRYADGSAVACLPLCIFVARRGRCTVFFFSSRRRHTRSVSAFLLNRSSDLRRFGGATCDDKSAQIYARFDKNDWRIQPAEFYRFHDAEVNTFGYF